MTAALSFAEHVVTIAFYLFLVVGVIAVLMYATGLTQQRKQAKPKPRHRAGDPPPEPQEAWRPRAPLPRYPRRYTRGWGPTGWLDRPVTDEERAAAKEFLAAMDDGESS